MGSTLSSTFVYDNHCFRADPGGFARQKLILLPEANWFAGRWLNRFEDTFVLRRIHRGLRAGALALTSPRRNETWSRAWGVRGTWAPWGGTFNRYQVVATSVPYFIFTHRLGGCSVGVEHPDNSATQFIHDGDGELNRMPNWGLTLAAADYGRRGKLNVTAFFWWNGVRWSMGLSDEYNTTACRLTDRDGVYYYY